MIMLKQDTARLGTDPWRRIRTRDVFDKREKPSGRLTLILLGVFVVACFIAALFIGDLAKLQEPVFASESLAALQRRR